MIETIILAACAGFAAGMALAALIVLWEES